MHFIITHYKPGKGEKKNQKLKVRKYDPITRKHRWWVEKKLPPHSKILDNQTNYDSVMQNFELTPFTGLDVDKMRTALKECKKHS